MQVNRRIVFLILVFFSTPGPATADTVSQMMVAEGVPLAVLEEDLAARYSLYLGQMISDADERKEYVRRLYANQQLEAAVVERGLAQDQQLLEELQLARFRLLTDALVRHEMGKSEEDLKTVARERYDANPEQYRTRKKIKIALIYIQKEARKEGEAQALIEEIVAQLRAEPGNFQLFKELARKHSDDKKAEQGGVKKEWLIAPTALENRDPLVQAAFAMDSVGQLTDIVETEKGFAVATLMAVTPASQISFGAARDRIVKELQDELVQRTKADLLQSLQPPEDLEVNVDLVKEKVVDVYRARRAAAAAQEE